MSTTDITARLRLTGEAAGAVKAANDTGSAVQSMGQKAGQAKTQLESAGSGARQFETGARGGELAARALGVAIGGIGVRALIRDLVDAAQASAGFSTGLGAVAGGASGAQSELSFVRSEALKMGMDIRQASSSFLELAGATNGTRLAGQQTREIWEGVMTAGLAMGRSNEQVQRGLEAISQVASKGVVSMEEIRQQLAEAIPGATNIAARAMGVTTAEFNKMVGQGTLLASDFLPKFAAALKSEFGPAVEQYLNTDIGKARVELGKLQTELFDLKVVGGQAFLAGVVEGVSGLNRALTEQETVEQVRALARELGALVGSGAQALGAFAKHADEIAVVLSALAGFKAGAMFLEWVSGAAAAAAEVGVLEAALTALGGPVAWVAAAGAAAIAALSLASADAAEKAHGMDQRASELEATLARIDTSGLAAASGTRQFGTDAQAAQALVEQLTGKVGALATAYYQAAAGAKAAAVNALMGQAAAVSNDVATLQARQQSQARFTTPLLTQVFGVQGSAPQDDGDARLKAQIAEKQKLVAQAQAAAQTLMATPLTDPQFGGAAAIKPEAPITKKTKADKAGDMAKDLAADVVALQQYRDALRLGGLALDEWKIKDTGRQAVEKAGLTHKGQLTAAESALAAKIRGSAEETERLKLANERVEKAIGLQRTAALDTQALKDRSAAAAAGVQALEDLQVKEAGLDALRQIGVESLDQLTAADRKEAEAAVAAAEAKDRQAIATQKAAATAATIRDLQKRIDQETARTAAIHGGVEAEVAYARAQFVRQEIERAGENLAAEQIAQIKAKADELFRVAAANDNAGASKQLNEELRLLKLTNRERDIEHRVLDIKTRLLKEHLELTEAEAEARARVAALAEQGAADDAKAIGDLKENLRGAFIETGKLSFDSIGDYAKKRLRAAIYDALLAKPINLLVNAVVQGLPTSMSAGMLGGSPLATAGMVAGSLIGGKGGSAIMNGIGAAMLPGMLVSAGSMGALGALSGGALALGLAAGPLAPVIGIIAGLATLFGGSIGGKPSNHAGIAKLTPTDFKLQSTGKETPETTQAVTAASEAVLKGEAALNAAGITLTKTVAGLDIGTRDMTHIFLSSGEELRSAVGDPAAAAETALKALLQSASYTDGAQKKLVDSMLAAGKGFDDITAALQKYQSAQALPQQIADQILQLTDPKAYAVKELKTQQGARRADVQAAADAGNLTVDQLAAINAQLSQLEGLELQDVLKRLGDAAIDATTRLNAAADLKKSVSDQILQLTDPTGFKVKQVNDEIDAQKAQALQLIAGGTLTAEVLDQLEHLRTLRIADAMGALSDQVTATAQAFAQARPQIRQWLDQLGGSASAELSPAAQREAALAAYEKNLAAARGGDATAASSYTSYADRLLQADRLATSSAGDRLALYNRVTSEGSALASMSAPAAVAEPLRSMDESLKLIAATGSTQLERDAIAAAAQAAKPVIVSNLPALQTIFSSAIDAQTTALVAANDKTRTELVGALGEVKAAIGSGLAAVEDRVAAVEGAASLQTARTGDLAEQLRIGNVYIRQAVSR